MPVGRHRNRSRADRHRRRRYAVAPWMVVVLVAGCVLGMGATGYTMAVRAGCDGPPETFTIVSSPDQAPILSELAQRWSATQPVVHGRCVTADVESKDPDEVADALGRTWDAKRDGPRPDVWAPDSTAWVRLAQARPNAAALIPDEQPSLAESPIVVAMPEPMAKAAGWPEKMLSWSDLVKGASNDQTWAEHGHPEWGALKLGMANPATDTAALGALLALRSQPSTGPLDRTQFLAASTTETSDLFDGLAQADDQGGALGYLSAFPAEERDVSEYNATNPKVRLVAQYAPDGVPTADHPYLVLHAKWVDATQRAAAEQLFTFLRSSEAQKVYAESGFRTYEGAAGPELIERRGFLPTVNAPRLKPLEPAQVLGAVDAWSGKAAS